MPRIPWSRLRALHREDPLLPGLFRAAGRSVDDARNELRWLREHAESVVVVGAGSGSDDNGSAAARRRRRGGARLRLLRRLCGSRSQGRPLQYVMGSQPFGDLDIRCKSGVLIPRVETESYTLHLAQLLIDHFARGPKRDPPLRILDLCTGTGCIPLLLHARLAAHVPDLRLHGIDVSPRAVALARENLHRNVAQRNLRPEALTQIQFARADILIDDPSTWARASDEDDPTNQGPPPPPLEWDILIANPPYISPSAFAHSTARSVRNWEPKLALVPPPPAPPPHPVITHSPSTPAPLEEEKYHHLGDTFYPRLLSLAHITRCKLILLETANLAQAIRVAHLARHHHHHHHHHHQHLWSAVGIWRDWPAATTTTTTAQEEIENTLNIPILGQGNGRAVLCWRDGGGEWIGRV